MTSKPVPSSKQELLVEDSIYTRYELSDLSWRAFIEKALEDAAVDAYCVVCEAQSVFRIDGGYRRKEEAERLAKQRWFAVEAQCSRDHQKFTNLGLKCEGRIIVAFAEIEGGVEKIGMQPSKARLDFGALDPLFSRELTKEDRGELGRAIGLRAHGIGVGSFVYLRRVIERLLEGAHSSALVEPGWNEDAYRKARVPERIDLLRKFLPSRMVASSKIYGILSKGLHELQDDECLQSFELVFQAIEMILRQRHEERAHVELLAKVSRAATPRA